MLGVVEATIPSDADKNRLCPAIRFWDSNADYAAAFLAKLVNEQARAAFPDLATWARETRLSPFGGIARYRDVPGVGESRERIKRQAAAAAGNLFRLLQAAAARV